MLLSCRWKDVDPDLPQQPLAGALTVSGLYDLEPLRHTPMVQADLRLTPASVARLFTRDNGSGKTQLCVRFATGAAIVIATEP
jgi:hypothetical protein